MVRGRVEERFRVRRGRADSHDRPGPRTPASAARRARFGAVHGPGRCALAVHAGEVVALLGDNGAGKSTLIKCISGAHRLTRDGSSWTATPVDDHLAGCRAGARHRDRLPGPRALRQPRRRRQLLRRPRAGAAALAPARSAAPAPARDGRDDGDVVRRLQVELPGVNGAVGLMSGGQRQAVAVARAAAFASRVVILDEPTAALGVRESRQVLDLIVRLRDEGKAVIVISHAMDHVIEVADRAVVHAPRTQGRRARPDTGDAPRHRVADRRRWRLKPRSQSETVGPGPRVRATESRSPISGGAVRTRTSGRCRDHADGRAGRLRRRRRRHRVERRDRRQAGRRRARQARADHEVPGRLLPRDGDGGEGVGQRHRRRQVIYGTGKSATTIRARSRPDRVDGHPGRQGHRHHADRARGAAGARRGRRSGRQGGPGRQRPAGLGREDGGRGDRQLPGGVLAGEWLAQTLDKGAHARRSSRACRRAGARRPRQGDGGGARVIRHQDRRQGCRPTATRTRASPRRRDPDRQPRRRRDLRRLRAAR